MKSCISFVLLFVLCFNFGCANQNALKRRMDAISTGTYAIKDSIDNNRYDLASKYSTQLVRLVPPPKHRIKILPLIVSEESSNQKYKKTLLVLPKENAAVLKENIIVEDTPDFQSLILNNSNLGKQQDFDIKSFNGFSGKVDKSIKEESKVQEELNQTGKHSWFGKLFSFLKWGGLITTILIVGGVLVIAIFFPMLWPIVLDIFGIFKRIFNFILNDIKILLDKIKNFKK